MSKVKISPKYQVVIPHDVRESMGLKPGEELQVFRFGDRIELVPIRKISDARGFLEGIDTTVDREDDRL